MKYKLTTTYYKISVKVFSILNMHKLLLKQVIDRLISGLEMSMWCFLNLLWTLHYYIQQSNLSSYYIHGYAFITFHA